MSATRRLYWTDPLLLSFEAEVVSVGEHAGHTAVELAETAFYPETGGQLADRGQMRWETGASDLVDAQDVDGRVLHLLEARPGVPLPAVGSRVAVRIDEARRRDHMSQHTGQHMLSRALLDEAGAKTVSSRLGESICTIDTPLPKIADDLLERAQERVNLAVLEDRPVRAFFPTPEELARIELRRELKVDKDVRIVEVEGFDFAACGGTHCLRTGQVGAVRIVGVERYKGGLRLSFHCGLRALRDYAAKDQVLTRLGRELSTGFEGVQAAVDRLRQDGVALAKTASALRLELARLVAERLCEKAPRVGVPPLCFVFAALDDEPIEYLRALAERIAERPEAVALLAARGTEGVRVALQRGSAAARFECGAAMKRLAAASGGRGGGRPDRAEGMLPAGADLAALAESERRRLEGA